jgi:hypothetical protein
MQYHASHTMEGSEEGGDGGIGGIKVGGGGVDTALPQVRFNIAQARGCMIECKGETRGVQVIKNTQQSAIQEGVTATMVAMPTKEGRRRWGMGQGNNANEVEEGHS